MSPKYAMVFADPPDNIGRSYHTYKDDIPEREYFAFIRDMLIESIRLAPVVWMSFNSKWTIEFALIAKRLLKRGLIVQARPCVQTYTFGTQLKTDLKYCYRPLWRFLRADAVLYPDQCLEPTWRLLNGDKRACPQGAVPGDVFDFPRVTGNSKQKRKWHDNQLHSGLVNRCIRLTTPEGSRVLDPFGGTGTTYRACVETGRIASLIEIDPYYCEMMQKETGIKLIECGSA